MGCPYGCIATVSTVIVAIQFIAKFLPWLYQNIIGPMVLAPKVSFRDYGKWACKYNYDIHAIELVFPI